MCLPLNHCLDLACRLLDELAAAEARLGRSRCAATDSHQAEPAAIAASRPSTAIRSCPVGVAAVQRAADNAKAVPTVRHVKMKSRNRAFLSDLDRAPEGRQEHFATMFAPCRPCPSKRLCFRRRSSCGIEPAYRVEQLPR
jgi:hypothetical protein